MQLVLFKRGKIWHYRGTIGGQRLRKSTRAEKRSDAEKIAIRVQHKAWQTYVEGPKATLTFTDATQHYREAGKSQRFLSALERYWGERRVMDIMPGDVLLAATRVFPKAQNSTRNRQFIGPTCAVINHAAGLGLCNTIRVRRLEEVVRVKTPVTLGWIKAFMEHANPHLGAFACFMFLTGARISETADVRWKDVDFETSHVLIRQSKISEERLAHMPAMLVAAISKIESNRRKDDKVFKYVSRNSVVQGWYKAIAKAGIQKLSPHCCRHGFATVLLHKGIDPVTVAKLGGWASAQHVFKTYGHAKNDDKLTDILATSDE